MTVVYTVGHGARPVEELVADLEAAGIRRLVDVRTAPGSRRHPQFGRDALAETLAERGIAYEWAGRELGGWRRPKPDSRHTGLRSDSFRGYADHMETPGFREALDGLIETSRETPTAIMCAEAVWWRCHRAMVADALTANGCEVRHLMPGREQAPHRMKDVARIEPGGVVVYDG